jgi:hypothetical protein
MHTSGNMLSFLALTVAFADLKFHGSCTVVLLLVRKLLLQ